MQLMEFSPERLKECREKAGLSIDQCMLELSNIGLIVHTNTLRNWEKGESEPDPSELAVLASFYKKPIQYFFIHKVN